MYAFLVSALIFTVSGPIHRVIDGDTLEILDQKSGKAVKIRLERIDAPELDQPGGPEAKKFLESLVEGKILKASRTHADRYGRVVTDVSTDGLDLGLELVRRGHAWQYRSFDKTRRIQRAELDAREALRGIWAEEEQIPPWEWRKKKKSYAASTINPEFYDD